MHLLKLFHVVCCNGWQGLTWIEAWRINGLSSFNGTPAKSTLKYIMVSAP